MFILKSSVSLFQIGLSGDHPHDLEGVGGEGRGGDADVCVGMGHVDGMAVEIGEGRQDVGVGRSLGIEEFEGHARAQLGAGFQTYCGGAGGLQMWWG